MVIRSEEDKRRVKSLAKRSKKKVNVYYNKKSKDGKSKYITGKFYSTKNDLDFIYRSSYELAFFMKLEEDEEVVKYIYEPLETKYIDSTGTQRTYIPDLMILYSTGKVIIAEIKPSTMLTDFDVRAKAVAMRKEIITNYEDIDMEFKFITEKDIFKDNNEYIEFVKKVKNGQIVTTT